MYLNISKEQEELFEKYYDLLIKWNSKINLTAITEKDEVWLKHFKDSLSLDRILDLDNVETVIDVGTGAGFPGIPLKIVHPHLKLTLIDSLDKRIRFLNTVIDELSLENVITIHGRAEDLAQMDIHREKYDLCVSRAVAALPVLTELCIPFVSIGGHFVSYKAEKASEEIRSAEKIIRLTGSVLNDVKEFKLCGSDISRTLIKIEKIDITPSKYPRRAGLPAKKPII